MFKSSIKRAFAWAGLGLMRLPRYQQLLEAESLLRRIQGELTNMRIQAQQAQLSRATAESPPDVDDLRKAIDEVRQATRRFDSVDFVRRVANGVFVFEDDLYAHLPEGDKRQSVEAFLRTPRQWGREHIDWTNWLTRIVAYHVDRNIDLTTLDIGGHWGLFSIEVATLLRHLGQSRPIVCFEPGATAELIRASVEINGFDDMISVRNVAVSDRTGPTLFYMHDACSQSNALIQHIHHNYARLSRTVDVREVLGEQHAEALLIKIDTEGMEETIIRAAESEPTGRQTIYVFEMAYGAPRERHLDFLKFLSSRYVLHDVPTQQRLETADFGRLVDGLIDRPARFTDLLCVPSGHPLNQALWSSDSLAFATAPHGTAGHPLCKLNPGEAPPRRSSAA